MSDVKMEELACPALACGTKVVVTVAQIVAGARVRCPKGHEFRLGGSSRATSAPADEEEWSRTSKKTIRFEDGKLKKD